MPGPWTPEQRSRKVRLIEREAKNVMRRLGAQYAVIIVGWRDGEHIHFQDAGFMPMPLKQLYATMTTSHQIVEESGGKDVQLS